MKSTFASRLKQACDDHKLVPPYGHGRQVLVAQRLKVSQEAVRKWFTGEAVPRREKIAALAKLLDVDEAWLALGIEPDVDRYEKRVLTSQTNGAVYALFGLFTVAGGHCAFPSERDPRRASIDMYVIHAGAQFPVHVSVGRETDDGYEFVIPREHDDIRCVGFVHRGGLKFQALKLTPAATAHLRKKGSAYVLNVAREGNGYAVDHERVAVVDEVGDLA